MQRVKTITTTCILYTFFVCNIAGGRDIDSTLYKYAITPSSITTAWNSQTVFYLSAASNEKEFPFLPAIIKRIDPKWQIFRIDNAELFKQLHTYSGDLIPANNYWKVAARLYKIAKANECSEGIYRVSFYNGYGKKPYRFSSVGISILKQHYDYNMADVYIKDRFSFTELLNNPDIISIEPLNKKPQPELAVRRFDKGTNYISYVQDQYPFLTGAGTVLSLKENLFDTSDIDLLSRFFFTPYSPTEIDVHATTMASMIAGSGNSYYQGKGIATASVITPADFNSLMPEPLDYYTTNNIGIQNHSYGTGIENEYAADAASYDMSTWNDTSLLHIFSAGNSGTSGATTGQYAGLNGLANITGSFKMSKNTLTVGGTDSFYRVESLSSRGPAYDGRIKPDLVAYGIDGTSGAAAITSGTALLLQQAIQKQTGKKAAAALIKALLINGTDDSGIEGPDYTSGFGSLNANRSIDMALKNHYFNARLVKGESKDYTITVPANTAWIKLTLAFTDTPASSLSSSAIMNDLDMTLTYTKDKKVFRPWILSYAPNKDSLSKPARRGIDRQNNVEVISILHPASGSYTITVYAQKVITASQTFSLAWHIEKADSITITHPTKTAAFFGNQTQLVRWSSSFADTAAGKLEYKFASNDDWKLITDNLPLRQQWFQWQTPDTVSKALLRITAASAAVTSDTFFISKNLILAPAYVCNDSVLLTWNKQPVDAYRVYRLGNSLPEPLSTTTDTFLLSKTSLFNKNYAAVAPIIGNAEGLKSQSIDFTLQGVGCYINNLLADLNGNEVDLKLMLGSTYSIAGIYVQKLTSGVFVNIDSTNIVAAETDFSDTKLNAGGNTYRVMIVLKNGTVIYSDQQTIFYLGKSIYLMYPNPVKQGADVYLINRYYDGNLNADLYDITGRLIKRINLQNASNIISTSGLQCGIYLLEYHDGSKKLGIDKLVIQ